MKAAAVIVASGAGRRLGGVAKALLRAHDRTFVDHIVTTASACEVRRALVVIGAPYADAVAREVNRLARQMPHLGLRCVVNPEPARGMGSSVSIGFAGLIDDGANAQSALLWPVDHPYVGTDALAVVLAHARADNVVIPTYRQQGGHPIAIGREYWQAMTGAGDAEHGARTIVREIAAAVRVSVDDAGVLRDVDVKDDLP